MNPMNKEDRDIQRKLKVLRHAEKTDHLARTCRYFGVGRSSLYRWKAAYEQSSEAGQVNAKPIPLDRCYASGRWAIPNCPNPILILPSCRRAENRSKLGEVDRHAIIGPERA